MSDEMDTNPTSEPEESAMSEPEPQPEPEPETPPRAAAEPEAQPAPEPEAALAPASPPAPVPLPDGPVFGEWRATAPPTGSGAHPVVNAIGVTGLVTIVRGVTPEKVATLSARAELGAKVLQPDAAAVLGWGVEGEDFWMAVEQPQGADLNEVLRDAGGRLSANRAAEILTHVLAALSTAEKVGLVHGDVRPENVTVAQGGAVKLHGLGVPAAEPGDALRHGASPEAAYWISPEQVRGERPASASDVYSVGALAYRMTAGVAPFDGHDAATVAAQHVAKEPEQLRRVNPDVPASFELAVAKAMAKDPAARYASLELMREDFARLAAGTPIAAERRPGRVWPWVAAALVVLALVGGALGGMWYLGYFAPKAEVPDLTGMTQTGAQKALTSAQLGRGDITYRPDYPDDVDEGTVIGQEPAPGSRVETGVPVDIVLAGAQKTTVPPVTGIDQVQAIMSLEGAGFRLGGIVSAFSTTTPAGQVISQVPSAGVEAALESSVTLTVSRGPESVTIASVVGQVRADAEKALKALGLVVTVREDFSDTVAKGSVVSQDPAAGVPAQKGGSVSLVVSRGPRKVTVPNVIGLSQSDAITDLQDLDLRIAILYQPSTTPTGKVTKQDPSKGASVLPDSIVTITVDKAP